MCRIRVSSFRAGLKRDLKMMLTNFAKLLHRIQLAKTPNEHLNKLSSIVNLVNDECSEHQLDFFTRGN